MKSFVFMILMLILAISCATIPAKAVQQPLPGLDGLNRGESKETPKEVGNDFSTEYPELEKVSFHLDLSNQTTIYHVRKDITTKVGNAFITSLRIEYTLRQRVVKLSSGYELTSEISDLNINGNHMDSPYLKSGANYSGKQRDYWGLLEGTFQFNSRKPSTNEDVINPSQVASQSEKPEDLLVTQQEEALSESNLEFWQRVYGFWNNRTFACGTKIDSQTVNIGSTEVWIPTSNVTIPSERFIEVVHRGTGDDYHLSVTDINPGKSSYSQPDIYIKADIYTTSGLLTKRLAVTGRLKGTIPNGDYFSMEMWMTIEKK